MLIPNDVPIEELECDRFCSPDFDDIYATQWFDHVLPQLRGRKWYGKTILETIQGPGETIYVPHNMGHAILNLDENLSLTENFLPESALGELAKYVALELMPFPYDFPAWAEKTWHNLYFRDLNGPRRRCIKSMRDQVSKKLKERPQLTQT